MKNKICLKDLFQIWSRPLSLLILLSGLCLAAGHVDPHSGDHHTECGHLLGDKNYKIIFSGRDHSVQDEITKYVELLYGADGVLKKLGYSTPPHIVQFLENRDLKAISANNRLPIGHWTEGAKVVQADNQPSGILEMVIYGQKTTHSIYRDDLNLKQQISIINHVVGHNHFGFHNRWNGKGDAPNQSAYEFDDYLEKLKASHSAAEISEWLQYLNSLTWAQDIKNADSELPSDFVDVTVEKRGSDGLLRGGAHHPKHPTANILQAFVSNLPRTVPEWKREVARRFEQSVRYIPGAVRTKIMNEGFAVLTQEIIPPHTPYTAEDDVFEYCCLMPGVIRPSLENPYWLGLEAWRNIRYAFNVRPEMKSLSLLERDRAFIKYATE